MQVDDVGVLRKCHHELGDSGTDVTDHDAADDQNAHALHPTGHRQHKGHGGHSPRKCGQDQGEGAGEQAVVQEHHHHQCYGQLGSAGNAHDKRPGDGVGKKGLQQIACRRECRAQQHHHHGPGQAQLGDDAHRQCVLPAAGQGRQHGTGGQGNTAPEQVGGKQNHQRQRQQEIRKQIAFFAGHKRFLTQRE